MDLDEAQARILEELKRREIHAFRSAPAPGMPSGVSLSMWANSAQRFIGFLVPGPLDVEDDLARRMVGRPQDLIVGEEPWGWGVGVGVVDDRYAEFGATGLELRIYVSIPAVDVPEVLRRLSSGG